MSYYMTVQNWVSVHIILFIYKYLKKHIYVSSSTDNKIEINDSEIIRDNLEIIFSYSLCNPHEGFSRFSKTEDY